MTRPNHHLSHNVHITPPLHQSNDPSNQLGFDIQNKEGFRYQKLVEIS